MNVIFGTVLVLSTILLIFTNPDAVLNAMLLGGEKAMNLYIKLIVIYAIWLGVFSLLEKTGLSNKLAKLLSPVNKFLYGQLPPSAEGFISMNMSANILGMSGATTPMGIRSIQELEKHEGTNYAITMFFVINATSIQIIPSSVLALRTSMGATSPADIVLPTILSTLVSTIVGILLVKIFVKKTKPINEKKSINTLPLTPIKNENKKVR